jgi:DNA mismatch endonuclease (patch repair protein)
MPDNRTPEQRSETMRAVHGKNTTPEWIVRRLLHAEGFRYRLHPSALPGKPDIVFPARRKAIFIHGCFWHAHGCRYGQPPKSRLDYWLPKLEANQARDAAKEAQLRELGWTVLTVWQCETREPRGLLSKLRRFLNRTTSPASARP